MDSDTFKTLVTPSEEILFKEKKSKFYGYAFPLLTASDAKPIIESLKKKHHTANHVCYAWRIGIEQYTYRTNDDGEPNNSAGMPIYGQIQSFEVTNVLVAVARIFGGTKLGVGGLIGAYRTAAHMALGNANIIEKVVTTKFELTFDYPQMDLVMRLIKQQQLNLVSQKLNLNCSITIDVRKNRAKSIYALFDALFGIDIQEIEFI